MISPIEFEAPVVVDYRWLMSWIGIVTGILLVIAIAMALVHLVPRVLRRRHQGNDADT